MDGHLERNTKLMARDVEIVIWGVGEVRPVVVLDNLDVKHNGDLGHCDWGGINDKNYFDYDDLIITVKNSQIIFEVATTGCEVCSGAFGVFEMRKSHF